MPRKRILREPREKVGGGTVHEERGFLESHTVRKAWKDDSPTNNDFNHMVSKRCKSSPIHKLTFRAPFPRVEFAFRCLAGGASNIQKPKVKMSTARMRRSSCRPSPSKCPRSALFPFKAWLQGSNARKRPKPQKGAVPADVLIKTLKQAKPRGHIFKARAPQRIHLKFVWGLPTAAKMRFSLKP